jgi:hypothetical protein
MTAVMKYKRVAMRLKEKFKDDNFDLKELENAIFIECGSDPRTVRVAIATMIRIGLICEVYCERVFGVHQTQKYRLNKLCEMDL